MDVATLHRGEKVTGRRHITSQGTMSDMIPELYHPPSEIRYMYMLHGRNPYQGDIPGSPIGLFYNYPSAAAALNIFDDPYASMYDDDQIVVFLVRYEMNSYGLLQNGMIYNTKTKRQMPERVSQWEQMQMGR